MTRRWRLAGAIGLLALGPPASAAVIEHLHIAESQNRFSLVLQARLSTPLDASFRTFRNFANLPAINDAVEEVDLRATPSPDVQRLYTRVRVCIWLFCTHLDQVQDIRRADDNGALGLVADVLPDQSNLRYGHAEWRMQDCEGQTCLSFTATLEPDFWVPPLIGPWAIERAMRREALQTANGIERLAAASE